MARYIIMNQFIIAREWIRCHVQSHGHGGLPEETMPCRSRKPISRVVISGYQVTSVTLLQSK